MKGYVEDIERHAVDTAAFRRVVYTGRQWKD